VQILLQLKGAGLVTSVRGAAGGYQLLIPPEKISLGRIMEITDGQSEGEIQSSGAAPDSPAVKVLLQAWNEVSAKHRKLLDEITLAELLERARTQGEQMYHI
jgi:Rrf2 family protein